MIVVIVAIIAGTVSSIAKHIFGVAKVAAAQKQQAEGSSLTTSELMKMVRAAVEEGTGRLEDRFDALEQRLDRMERQAPPPLPAAGEGRIDPGLLLGEEEREPAPAPRRTRTS
jgi:ubiquinone biosynthesis protein UbiJ